MRGALHARSPDGREWEIRVHRIRLPSWPDSHFDPDDWGSDTVIGAFVASLVLGPIFWLVIPLLRVIVALPFVVVRSLFSSTRTVGAWCGWPHEVSIRWETTREHADTVAREIAARLPHGYADLTPNDAFLISMTEPPGADDRFA